MRDVESFLRFCLSGRFGHGPRSVHEKGACCAGTSRERHLGRGKVVMVGPDFCGKGGISRVVSVWRDAGTLKDLEVEYVASVGPRGNQKIYDFILGLLKLGFLLIRRPSLVYSHTASNMSFFRKSIFILLAIACRRRVVVHVHPTAFWKVFIPGLVGLRKKYAAFVLGQIGAFIVLTEEQSALARAAFPMIPVRVLANPVNFLEFSEGRPIKRLLNRLLYLGWYVREKGVYDLVDAVALLTKRGLAVELECYGTNGKRALIDYVERMGLQSRVWVKGWIGEEEKIDALHRASLFVFPSHNEGVPNAVLEAMAAGTPIVSTLVGGLREVLRHGENALIAEARNHEDFADKIEQCLRSPGLRAYLAENAQRDVKEKYDVKILAERFRTIIEEVTLPELGLR
jgi:glycosyltransferase involved in cell wall biosynthesis